jgi:DNA-binding NarL/FixJ family response regulator
MRYDPAIAASSRPTTDWRALELTLALRVVDLLVTNTRMPGLNGPELIRHVREEMPNLPILYIANKGTKPGISDGLPANVPTLRERFSRDELLEAVRALLERRG